MALDIEIQGEVVLINLGVCLWWSQLAELGVTVKCYISLEKGERGDEGQGRGVRKITRRWLGPAVPCGDIPQNSCPTS